MTKHLKGLTSLFLSMTLAACDGGRDDTRLAATPQARHALGKALPYPAEPLNAEAVERARTSLEARRALGWRIVEKILKPVPLSNAVRFGSVPLFLGWYAKDDLQRSFDKLYADLGKDGRRVRLPFTVEALHDVEAWNAAMVRDLPSWPDDRLAPWLATLSSDERRGSLAGLSRTLYSPSAATHLLANYASASACPKTADDAPFDSAGPSDDNFSLCFASEMPESAVVIKTSWRRADFGMQVETFDTGAEAMARRLQAVGGSWETADGTADPGASQIFSMVTDAGARFRLVGLHVMTKEQRDWTWVTLWWSPAPDGDFGEDRTDGVRALGGPWSSYKMCVVTSYDEAAAVDDEMRAQHPSLAAALDATIAHTKPRTWCSNPYIEAGALNHATQCIGCHQHGGATIATEAVLAGGERFPDMGRAKTRANFPADYLWSLGRGPELISGVFAERIRYYDIYDALDDRPRADAGIRLDLDRSSGGR